MLYKYTWIPVIKGTYSLITDLTFWELWLTWASETLLQVTPPGSKLTCINREETNRRDNGLHSKVTLVPNSSYLFSAGTKLKKIITHKAHQSSFTHNRTFIFINKNHNREKNITTKKNKKHRLLYNLILSFVLNQRGVIFYMFSSLASVWGIPPLCIGYFAYTFVLLPFKTHIHMP